MKGFPNQIADLGKIATGIRVLRELIDSGANPRDDGVYGPALVRAGVAGTGHVAKPVEAYIRDQLKKQPSNQSFRTTARGLRELYRLLKFIDDSGDDVRITALGRQAAKYSRVPLKQEQTEFWRKAVRNIIHWGYDQPSHPYQVLLRLVARKPGITRAKCALALEARNNSTEELDRIVTLADLSEEEIRNRIGATKSNWDNAKKVLPKFAEQLGDVVRTGHQLFLASGPGRAQEGVTEKVPAAEGQVKTRAPRTSREASPETIARTSTVENFDEVKIPADSDPAAVRRAIELRRDRLRRHNLLVTELAERLHACEMRLYADPFDALALTEEAAVLIEVKSLDGTPGDERDRVQEALAQLLYYEAFVAAPMVGDVTISKVACFEGPITAEHQEWLNNSGIATLWRAGEKGVFEGDELAAHALGGCLEELTGSD